MYFLQTRTCSYVITMQSKNQAVNSFTFLSWNPTPTPVLLIVLITSRITHLFSCLLSPNLKHFLDFHGQDTLKDFVTVICRISLHLDLSKVSSILFRGWSRAGMPQKWFYISLCPIRWCGIRICLITAEVNFDHSITSLLGFSAIKLLLFFKKKIYLYLCIYLGFSDSSVGK